MTRSRLVRLATGGLATALTLAGCSNGSGRPDVAAVVEGTEIPAADTEELIDTYLSRQSEAGAGEPRDKVSKSVLNYQIELALLDRLAQDRGIQSKRDAAFEEAASAVDPEAFQAVGMRSQELQAQLRAADLAKAIAAEVFPEVDITEAELTLEYERRKSTFDRSWTAKVKIAQFGSEAEAGQVQAKVGSGQGFDEAATGVGALQVDSVDVNPIIDDLPADLLDAIGATTPGQVSPAVEVASGWLAVLVEQREDRSAPTLDDLRPELTALLTEVKRERQFEEWFKRQFQNADVEVDGFYGDWDSESTAVL